MKTQTVLFIAFLLVVLLFIHRRHRIETLPRREYLRAVREGQLFTKQEWINEIMIRHRVCDFLEKDVSKRRNSFNLRRLVHEGLIEYKPGETCFQGEHVIPVATFKITEKGLDEYQGSPS